MTEPEIRAETTPMADAIYFDRLEALLVAYKTGYRSFSGLHDPSFELVAAIPRLMEAARERDGLRALLDRAEEALSGAQGDLVVGGPESVRTARLRLINETIAEIRSAKATT